MKINSINIKIKLFIKNIIMIMIFKIMFKIFYQKIWKKYKMIKNYCWKINNNHPINKKII